MVSARHAKWKDFELRETRNLCDGGRGKEQADRAGWTQNRRQGEEHGGAIRTVQTHRGASRKVGRTSLLGIGNGDDALAASVKLSVVGVIGQQTRGDGEAVDDLEHG